MIDQHARLERATADLDPPFAVVDLAAFQANAADMVRRAGGKPIRVASKSVRCRELLKQTLSTDGFAGVLAFTLPEALWLATDDAFIDVVVAYPTTHRSAVTALGGDEHAASRVTLMIDSVEHLDFLDSVVPPEHRATLRVCIDTDASLRLAGGRVHLGVRRSPVHSAAQAASLAQIVVDRPGFRLVGLMAYEAQIAGLGDRPRGKPVRGLAVRGIQRWSRGELAERRAAIVAAVSSVSKLEFVNGGGTGSLETTSREDAVTEVAAGSGLYGPTLFDSYRAFTPQPAAMFALSVVRRPCADVATVLGGGWIASGPAESTRLPAPVYPPGLALTGGEGAGEVQSPLTGAAARDLRIGDRVWFRHAKAGELCEHVPNLHLVDGDAVTQTVPTYRGEGRTFL
jgi:D-serine deaminase-like pyridoxal phosphate-dependent protein